MSKEDWVFLETTIAYELHFYTEERCRELESQLQGKKRMTSTYILGEFVTGLLHNAVALIDIVMGARNEPEVLIQIAQRFGRDANKCLLLYAHVSKLSHTKEEKISQLRMLVEWLLIDIFMEGIDMMIDETSCKFAKRKPSKKGTSYELETACVQSKKECEICAFWRHHESELRAIAAALKSAHRLDKSQRRMLARIEKVLDFGMIRARGFRSCRALSDAVIATEMPGTVTLMTTNKRHFELLCSALGKKLFN